MFGDEGCFVVRGGVEGRKVVDSPGVAEGDTDVAEEAVAFDSFDGGFGEKGAELFDVESEEIAEAVLEDLGSGVEAGFAGNLRETIPGAGVETIVAAVDSVADGAAKFHRYAAFVFDGEIGDTTCGGELSRAGDCLGRAGLDAGGAFSAVIAGRRVGVKFEGGEEFAEEKPGAELAVDLDGGLAIPAEAGGACKIAFEDGAGIDVVTLLAAHVFESEIEVLELVLDEVVVVVVPRIAGNTVSDVGIVFRWKVIQRE